MGVASFVREQRDKQILAQAEPYLQDGEEVVDWVRAHEYDGKRRGYVFLTEQRLLVHWTDGRDRIMHFPWEEIDAWGVSDKPDSDPVVGVETESQGVLFELRVSSQRSVGRIRGFLRRLARQAPKPRTDLRAGRKRGLFHSRDEIDLTVKKRSVAGHTKRIVVTIIGLTLIVVGVAIVLFPGPWSAPLIIGGLAILASEYDWAEDIMNWSKEKTRRAKDRLKARRRASKE